MFMVMALWWRLLGAAAAAGSIHIYGVGAVVAVVPRGSDGAGGARGSRGALVLGFATRRPATRRQRGAPVGAASMWAVNTRARAVKPNEGDWVGCLSIAHFTNAVSFSDVQTPRALRDTFFGLQEAKYSASVKVSGTKQNRFWALV